jgi:hypothetical protein
MKVSRTVRGCHDQVAAVSCFSNQWWANGSSLKAGTSTYPAERYIAMASLSALFVSSRAVVAPLATASASSSASNRRAIPAPRADSATHIRFTSEGAPDRLAAPVGDEELAGWRGDLVGLGGDPGPGVKAGVRATMQLGEVGAEAALRVVAPQISRSDLDRRGGQQPGDRAHRADEFLLLVGAERSQDGLGQVVAAAIEDCSL